LATTKDTALEKKKKKISGPISLKRYMRKSEDKKVSDKDDCMKNISMKKLSLSA